jgi:hypothetical protein
MVSRVQARGVSETESSMKPIKKLGAQGDVIFRKVRSLPKGALEQPVNGPIIVAHSETQHHHAIDVTDGVRLFQPPGDPMVCYLVMEGVEYADVVHHRPFDTHETLRLLGTPQKRTVFEVRRQREYTPEGWRRVED